MKIKIREQSVGVSRRAIEDPKISLAAKGLLAYLCSLPEDTDIKSFAALSDKLGEDKDEVMKAYDCLYSCPYRLFKEDV